jgi:hypothetical protein
MLRIALISGLLISFFLLVRTIAGTWQEEVVPVMPVSDQASPATMSENRRLVFYPRVPAELPDLNLGYLFNEARLLVVEPKNDKKDAEPMIAIADVSYIGSVISSDRRVGIIGYQEQGASIGLQQSSGRTRPGGQAAAAVDKHAHLAPGENFSGYLVVDVLPEKIVFEKDGIKIEKSIVKVNKDRRTPMPQLQVDRRTQGRPPTSMINPGQEGGAPFRRSDPGDTDFTRPSAKERISAGRTQGAPTRI